MPEAQGSGSLLHIPCPGVQASRSPLQGHVKELLRPCIGTQRTECLHIHLLGHPHWPRFAGLQRLALGGICMKEQFRIKGCLWNLHPNNTILLALPGMVLPQPTNCLLVLEDPSGHMLTDSFIPPLIHSALHSLTESFIYSPSKGVILESITTMANA